MVKLFGKTYRKDELLRYVGDIQQVGGVRLLNIAQGVEKGVGVVSMRAGELSMTVVVDRCLDLADVEFRGIPLGWISSTGLASPSFFEPEGLGWLRGFFGGLLTTCGLTYMGAPTVDGDEPLGLHGRISYSPAKLTKLDGEWIDDEYILFVEGEVRETKVFEPNLVLRRRIETKLGGRSIVIRDKVVNEGWTQQPFMILYHFNIGFPILDRGANLVSTSRLYVPRDKEAMEGAEAFDRFEEPVRGFKEKVYFHDLGVDSEGFSYAGLINEELGDGGLGVVIKFRKAQLRRFYEWKMIGEGTYVVGLEPANALPMGRDWERRWGTLPFIDPQEEKTMELEVLVLEGEREIAEYRKKIEMITGGLRPRMLSTVDEFVRCT